MHMHQGCVYEILRKRILFISGRHLDGIWHTSIVVFGREYFFGGGGIVSCKPVSFFVSKEECLRSKISLNGGVSWAYYHFICKRHFGGIYLSTVSLAWATAMNWSWSRHHIGCEQSQWTGTQVGMYGQKQQKSVIACV